MARSMISVHAGAGTEPLSQTEHVAQPSTWWAQLSMVTCDLKSEARDATGKSREKETIPLSYKIKPANKQHKNKRATIVSLQRNWNQLWTEMHCGWRVLASHVRGTQRSEVQAFAAHTLWLELKSPSWVTACMYSHAVNLRSQKRMWYIDINSFVAVSAVQTEQQFKLCLN